MQTDSYKSYYDQSPSGIDSKHQQIELDAKSTHTQRDQNQFTKKYKNNLQNPIYRIFA